MSVDLNHGAPGATGESSDARRRLTARVVDHLPWWVLGVFGVIIVVHATGAVGALAYPVVLLGGVACGIVGLRRHRPDPTWPWWIPWSLT